MLVSELYRHYIHLCAVYIYEVLKVNNAANMYVCVCVCVCVCTAFQGTAFENLIRASKKPDKGYELHSCSLLCLFCDFLFKKQYINYVAVQ